MRPVILFDANETLLDLTALDPHFHRIFGDPGVRTLWFRQVVELFLTASVIDAYASFDVLTDAALDMVAGPRAVDVSAADRAALRTAVLSLPPHADTRAALERLRTAGFRLAVLTNSTQASAKAQMQHGGLAGFFDEILSADTVRRYKPAREAYAHAAKALTVELGDIRLVAAHGWDIAGALMAGCKAAFVARPGKALNPHSAQPDISGPDLGAVAEAIVRQDG